MPRLKRSRDQWKVILTSALKQGKTRQQVANQLGVCFRAVRVWTEALKIDLPKPRITRDRKQWETILTKALQQGKTLGQVAEDAGVTDWTVRITAQKLGIKFPKPQIRLTREQWKDILTAAVRDGKTLHEAAKEAGAAYSTLAARAQELGVKFLHGSSDGPRLDWRATLEAAARDGKSLHDVAAQVGAPYKIVASRARRFGVKMPRHARQAGPSLNSQLAGGQNT